jgi:hypothetical protein
VCFCELMGTSLKCMDLLIAKGPLHPVVIACSLRKTIVFTGKSSQMGRYLWLCKIQREFDKTWWFWWKKHGFIDENLKSVYEIWWFWRRLGTFQLQNKELLLTIIDIEMVNTIINCWKIVPAICAKIYSFTRLTTTICRVFGVRHGASTAIRHPGGDSTCLPQPACFLCPNQEATSHLKWAIFYGYVK